MLKKYLKQLIRRFLIDKMVFCISRKDKIKRNFHSDNYYDGRLKPSNRVCQWCYDVPEINLFTRQQVQEIITKIIKIVSRRKG